MSSKGFIVFDHIPVHPLECSELEVIVTDSKLALYRGMTQEGIDQIWQKEGISKGKKDLERYYLVKCEQNPGFSACLEFHVALGTYKTFFAGHILLQELQKANNLSQERLEEFFRTTHSILGLNVIVALQDGLLYGARSQYVTQGKGMFLPPAGGFMPSDFEDKHCPDPFVSAQKQLSSETGIQINLEQMRYLGIARSTGSENASLIFFVDLPETRSSDVLQLLKNAPDKYEHNEWVLVPIGKIPDFLSGTLTEFRSIKTGHSYFTQNHLGYETIPESSQANFLLVGLAGAALFAYYKHDDKNIIMHLADNPQVSSIYSYQPVNLK